MITKAEKCHSFGMKNYQTKFVQIKPKLYLNNKLINTVKIDESFVYLVRYFDFNMTNKDHKVVLLSKTNDLFNTIDELSLYSKNKILLYQRYVLSKISWHLPVADILITWVKQNLDNIASKFIRQWLEIPIASTLNVIRQSKNKFGLGITLLSDRFTQCQVTLRNKFKNSSNQDIVEIYDVSKGKNTTYDQYKSTREAINDIRNDVEIDTSTFTTQGLVVKTISDYADKKHTTAWHKALSTLPKNTYSFAIRYLNNTLANNTNLRLKNLAKCDICDGNETLRHVVGGCKTGLDKK